jgi:hypothetical protein
MHLKPGRPVTTNPVARHYAGFTDHDVHTRNQIDLGARTVRGSAARAARRRKARSSRRACITASTSASKYISFSLRAVRRGSRT